MARFDKEYGIKDKFGLLENMGFQFNRVSTPSNPPVNTVAPVISGTTTLGSVLSCTTGTWINGVDTYTYQWYRGVILIVGETNSTYTTVLDDSLADITCQVTATNITGSATAKSNIVTLPNYAPANAPLNTVLPVISGTPTLGSVLSTTDGTWTGDAVIVYTYQWYRNYVAIGSETNSTYTTVLADSLADIVCVVKGTNGVGFNSATSNIISLPSYAPVNTVAPSISGSIIVGNVLTRINGTYTNSPSISGIWQRNGIDIAGQTNSTYTTVTADIGQSITWYETANNGVSPNATISSNTLNVYAYSLISDDPLALVDMRVASAADVELFTLNVGTWYNSRGLAGVNATEATNRPDYNAAVKCLDFVSANSDKLTFEQPITMNCDSGWSLLIGYKQLTNDRYLLGGTDTSSFRIFTRNANISLNFNATTSKLFTYATWGITKPTGRTILELTHNGGVANSITARMNNANPYTSAEAGTLLLDRTYFNQIGAYLGASFFNGQIGFIYFQNKPFTAGERTAKYNELSAIYIPE